MFFLNKHLSTRQTLKREFQKWLNTIPLDLFVTVEPTPYSPMNDDEIKQRIRYVDLHINKRFVGNNFSKPNYKIRDRSFWIGFFEDGHTGRTNRHSHLLVYLPFHNFKEEGSNSFLREQVKTEILFRWTGVEPETQIVTNTEKTKHWFKVLNSENRSVPPLYIESDLKSRSGVSRYSSKRSFKDIDYDDYFFSF